MPAAARSGLALAVFAALAFGAAMLGGQWGANAWYAALAKPWFTPPGWVYPIAWTALYIIIGIAGWLVWRRGGRGSALALGFWGAQLALNAIWSFLFFGQRNLGLALADISGMWIFILAFIIAAWRIDRRAALLFVPYLLWVSFAGYLNYVILTMNGAGVPQ